MKIIHIFKNGVESEDNIKDLNIFLPLNINTRNVYELIMKGSKRLHNNEDCIATESNDSD